MIEHLTPEPLLVPGFHGTRAEIDFVNRVIRDHIRGAGYLGQIELVGSRVDGWWVSRRWFEVIYPQVAPETRDHWLNFLNQEAKKHNFNTRELPLLADFIPEDAPAELFEFLEDGCAGSDFDLLLKVEVRPSGIAAIYVDNEGNTGQSVDVWVEKEEEL